MSKARAQSIQRSIRHHMIASAAVIMLLAGGVGGWAATTRLASAVIAHGSVVVGSHVKKIQHPTGGVVRELHVRDGDHVGEGEILLSLDDTITRANLGIVSKGLDELTARRARLDSESEGLDEVKFSPDLLRRGGDPEVARILAGERNLFTLRRSARLGQKAQLAQQVTQIEQQIDGFNAQAEAKAHEIELVKRELQGVRALWQQKLTPLTKLTELERQAARLDGERAQLLASVAQAKYKITETKLQILQIDQDLASDVAKQLRETDAKIDEYGERKVAAEDQLRRMNIRAPQAGTVFELAAHTVGGVITPGETIMQIVPESDSLMVEAKIRPQDIDQVKVGDRAMLRFTAFNVRTTPELPGTVQQMSADTTTDKSGGEAYYTMRVAIPATELSILGNAKLIPGMPVDAFVQTGERDVLSYLMKPLQDQLARAFTEK